MNNNDIKNTIKNVIQGLLDATEAEAKDTELYKFILGKIEKATLGIDDPEDFYYRIMYDFNNVLDAAVSSAPSTNDWLVKSIFLDYAFFDNHLTKFCETLEGPAYSTDKSRYLLKCVVKCRINGGRIQLHPCPENFHHPKTGNWEMWLKYVEGVGRLRHGDPGPYLKAYKNLIDCRKGE